jgi:hypothetical protein
MSRPGTCDVSPQGLGIDAVAYPSGSGPAAKDERHPYMSGPGSIPLINSSGLWIQNRSIDRSRGAQQENRLGSTRNSEIAKSIVRRTIGELNDRTGDQETSARVGSFEGEFKR